MRKYLEEIPKGVLKALGGVLGIWLLAVIPEVIRKAEHFPLTDEDVVSIRSKFFIVGLLLLGGSGWFAFFRARTKIRMLEKEMGSKPEPHLFQDDFTFDPRLGLYRHKTKPGYFCGSCTPKGVESPLKERGDGWRCLIRGCENWHSNPDYKSPPKEPKKYDGW